MTATIANGKSQPAVYTQQFTINVYDAGSDDGTKPFIGTRAKDDMGGTAYITVTDSAW